MLLGVKIAGVHGRVLKTFFFSLLSYFFLFYLFIFFVRFQNLTLYTKPFQTQENFEKLCWTQRLDAYLNARGHQKLSYDVKIFHWKLGFLGLKSLQKPKNFRKNKRSSSGRRSKILPSQNHAFEAKKIEKSKTGATRRSYIDWLNDYELN